MEALMKRINDRNGNGSEEKKTRPVQQQIAQILGINSNGGTNLNEEDDLEVTIVQRDDPRSLKCPITRQLFENPVKNKICGHSYDKEAIIQHLRIARNKKCPVAGCNNINIKADQLLENIELTQEVRRYKRRVDLQKERDMTQAIGLDSDEED
jgi:SUMO ligase MMS21 Smc5/6 complex component